VLIVERAAERPLGACGAEHVVLLRVQQVPPLVVGVVDLEVSDRRSRRTGGFESEHRPGRGERTQHRGAEQYVPSRNRL
jgi:hypothetical protein